MSFFHKFNLKLILVVAPLLISSCSQTDQMLEADEELRKMALASLSQIEGEKILEGLTEQVEVVRDKYGIPHIYAQNIDDLFFAQGYVISQDRLWQLEMWRRWRTGLLAEVFGPEAFDYDLRTRLMMYRGPFNEKERTS